MQHEEPLHQTDSPHSPIRTGQKRPAPTEDKHSDFIRKLLFVLSR